MYHRLLKILIATQDPELETLLRGVSPLERFSHQIDCRRHVDDAAVEGYAMIILDGHDCERDAIRKIHAAKDDGAVLISCFDPKHLHVLPDVYEILDQVWVRPLVPEKILASFAKMQKRFREREDAVLTEKYLDTLIDSLPDLVWFKDARGAHLKVNASFCRAVDKTKSQIQNRGHYYIWDIEPDEYAQGEYICLESEEIVLNKKETCLFDETVKCRDELRKFKT